MMTLCLAVFGHTNVFAATSANTLVNNAMKAGKTLSDASIIGKKATGKNVPTKEYNMARKQYNTAIIAVNKQKGKEKQTNLAKLKTVNTQISRGKKYIDAVIYGKNIAGKKAILDKYVKTNVIDTKLINSYTALSGYVKKYSSKFDAVYDKKTRDTIKKLYKAPADKIIKDLNYAVTVKKAINDTNQLIKASSSSSKLAESYYKIVLYIDFIPQSKFKQQLKTEVKKLNTVIPSKLKTGKFAEYVVVETQYEQLDALVSKGKSNEKVPDIYESLSSNIKSTNSSANKALLQKRLTSIMNQMKVSVKELKGMLTKAAITKGIPPEVVKSIAVTENGSLTQFQANGEVFKSDDKGYGIMQVTLVPGTENLYDWNRIKYDIFYNIQKGVDILFEKWNYTFLPTVNSGQINVLENWYFAIMAYNGLFTTNNPNGVNNKPYQLKVYDYMKNRTLMEPEIVNKKDADFTINPLKFVKMKVETIKQTKSTQLFKVNAKVTITSNANYRSQPTTINNTPKLLRKGSKVTILSGPIEDDNQANLFIWYKVSISGIKGTWYIASSNLQ